MTATKPSTNKPATKRPNSNRLSEAASAQPSSADPRDGSTASLQALQNMVEPGKLSVVFQPIVEMATGKLYAYEALVRSSAPEFKSPPELFDRAVELGCTGRLGRMIREIGVPLASGVPLFVNIHPAELSEGWLVRPDDPVFAHDDEVFLEVTESVPMSHYDLCMSVVKEVGSRGSVHVVVDDLGAGYSNLMRIADLEPRIVKLDRNLVAGIDRNRRQRDLVTAVVDLCIRLGAKVVAEGVETEPELIALAGTGAHYAQGFLLARPAFPPPSFFWPPTGQTIPSMVPPTRRSD